MIFKVMFWLIGLIFVVVWARCFVVIGNNYVVLVVTIVVLLLFKGEKLY